MHVCRDVGVFCEACVKMVSMVVELHLDRSACMHVCRYVGVFCEAWIKMVSMVVAVGSY